MPKNYTLHSTVVASVKKNLLPTRYRLLLRLLLNRRRSAAAKHVTEPTHAAEPTIIRLHLPDDEDEDDENKYSCEDEDDDDHHHHHHLDFGVSP